MVLGLCLLTEPISPSEPSLIREGPWGRRLEAEYLEALQRARTAKESGGHGQGGVGRGSGGSLILGCGLVLGPPSGGGGGCRITYGIRMKIGIRRKERGGCWN